MVNSVDTRAQIDTETVRALLLVNGGGVVALLALLPVILDRRGLETLAIAILAGVVLLTVGLVFAIVHNQLRRQCSLIYSQHGMRPPAGRLLGFQLRRPTACFLSLAFMWLSLGAFAAGGISVGWIGFVSLGVDPPTVVGATIGGLKLTTLLDAIRWASAIIGVVAAALAVRAATVHIRNSIDDFMADIHRQSNWATWAAIATSFTALLLVVQTFLDR